MSETKTTPGPWRLSDSEGDFVLGADSRPVCQLFSKSEEEFPNAKANAAFIVRAVNNHHAMLEVLKEADHLLGYFHWDSSTGRTDKFELVQKIREAISAAGS